MSAAGQFLREIFRGIPNDARITISAPTGPNNTNWISEHCDSFDTAVEMAAEADKHDYNVYVGVGARCKGLEHDQRGRKVEVVGFGCLWLDLDIGKVGHAADNCTPDEDAAAELLKQMPHSPSIVVRSGGGLHVYWLLDEWCADAGRVEGVCKRWQQIAIDLAAGHGWHVDAKHDRTTVLRVPGTRNHKSTSPRPVELLMPDEPTRYALADLEAACPPKAAAPVPAPVPSSSTIDLFRLAHGKHADVVRRAIRGQPLADKGARHKAMVQLAAAMSMAFPDAGVDEVLDAIDLSLQAMTAEGVDEDAREHMRKIVVDEYATAPVYRAKREATDAKFRNAFGGGRDASSEADDASRVEIKLDPNLAKMTDEIAAVLGTRPDAKLYQRSGLLVRLVDVKRAPGIDVHAKGVLGPDGVRRPEGSPVIQAALVASVHETVARVCKFTKTKKTTDKKTGNEEKVTVEVPAPRNVVEMFAARGSWELPILETVAESPRMRVDGSVIQSPGLDVATGVYYRPVVDYPAVPDVPTRADALAALELLKYPLIDFPFVEEHHRSAALAAILTVAAGPRIAGPRPMFEVGASTPGEGKGKLVNVISIVGNGRAPACLAPPKDEIESNKVIVSLAIAGSQVIMLDNASGLIGTPSMAMALTSCEIEGRVLGLSRMARVPINATWFVTGNNISYTADLARRVVPITLDAGVEHPEDRKDWKEPHLLDYCMRERPRLAVAALTVLRAHAVAKQPLHGGARKGSFEAWDDVVRSALIWLGCADPLGGVAELREHADADRDAIAEFMAAWESLYGTRAMNAADVVEEAQAKPLGKLKAALMAFVGAVGAKELGFKLREVKGRLVGGRRFLVAGKAHGRTSWSLVVAK